MKAAGLTIFLGLLLAIPWGLVADRWGRKPVWMLSMLGACLSDTWVKLVCKSSPLDLFEKTMHLIRIRLVPGSISLALCLGFILFSIARWRSSSPAFDDTCDNCRLMSRRKPVMSNLPLGRVVLMFQQSPNLLPSVGCHSRRSDSRTTCEC